MHLRLQVSKSKTFRTIKPFGVCGLPIFALIMIGMYMAPFKVEYHGELLQIYKKMNLRRALLEV